MTIVLVMLWVLMGPRAVLCGAQSVHQQLYVGDEVCGIIVGNAQGRHAYAGVFGGKCKGGGVLAGPHLFRILEIAHEPAARPMGGDAIEIGSDTVAMADRVAGRA